MFPILGSAMLMVCLLTGVVRADDANVGFRLVELEDPVSRKPMAAAVFFPTPDRAGVRQIGPLEIAAVRDAVPQAGRHPLVVLSHGSGASLSSHQDTAIFLARHGYLVAAIEHPGDNYRDQSGLGSDRVLVGRSLQLRALLDFLLAEPPFSTAIDATRIGVAGFSAGGYTALVMVGAQPKFALLEAYCARYANSVLCSGGGRIGISSPPLIAHADSRIRGAFVMSPVAAFFDRESVSSIAVPVEIYAADHDSVLPIDGNARWLRDNLPTLAGYTEIAGADHFVFLAPCSSPRQSAKPDLCVDSPGIDRLAVHAALNGDMLRFFQSFD